MTDVAIKLIDNRFQLSLDKGDLVADDGLETAVIISLFTNKRVPVAELPPGTTNRQGWWGDLFPDVENDEIGSKLWTFSREKISNALIPKVETEVKNALDWMITDGVAKAIDVETTIVGTYSIKIFLEITKPDNERNQFAFLWDGQELKG